MNNLKTVSHRAENRGDVIIGASWSLRAAAGPASPGPRVKLSIAGKEALSDLVPRLCLIGPGFMICLGERPVGTRDHRPAIYRRFMGESKHS